MSRLCAIAMLCAVVCAPAFASEDERILEEEQTTAQSIAMVQRRDI